MPWDLSSSMPTACSNGAQKLGQPVPLSNLVVEENSVEPAAGAGEGPVAMFVEQGTAERCLGAAPPEHGILAGIEERAPFGIGMCHGETLAGESRGHPPECPGRNGKARDTGVHQDPARHHRSDLHESTWERGFECQHQDGCVHSMDLQSHASDGGWMCQAVIRATCSSQRPAAFYPGLGRCTARIHRHWRSRTPVPVAKHGAPRLVDALATPR